MPEERRWPESIEIRRYPQLPAEFWAPLDDVAEADETEEAETYVPVAKLKEQEERCERAEAAVVLKEEERCDALERCERLREKFTARAKELSEMRREWEQKPGGRESGRLNHGYAIRCEAVANFIRSELLPALQHSPGDETDQEDR